MAFEAIFNILCTLVKFQKGLIDNNSIDRKKLFHELNDKSMNPIIHRVNEVITCVNHQANNRS